MFAIGIPADALFLEQQIGKHEVEWVGMFLKKRKDN